MNYLNYEFFDEFKKLDNLCRDIYGKSADNKLGVTLYLDDMDKNSYLGNFKVENWSWDYAHLKRARHIRNELAHSRNSFSVDLCSQEEIDFVRSFRERILNQTDPLALLREKLRSPNSNKSNANTPQHRYSPHFNTPLRTAPRGCLGIVATIIVIVICIISFLI
jgi:hypothetical protein